MKQTTLLLLIFFAFANFYVKGDNPPIFPKTGNFIKNGSFEYGLNTSWEHKLTNGSQATFNLEDKTNVKHGSYALRVDVSSVARGNNNSVISSTQVTVGSDSIYLMRFWACGAEESKIYVEVEGCINSGILYEMHTGQTVFYFPFKVDPDRTDRNLKINFYFRDDVSKIKEYKPASGGNPEICKVTNEPGVSYYIDDVQIFDSNNDQSHDVHFTYMWNYNRVNNSENRTWSAGDNDVSIALPDGRVMWLFNDSFYGKNHPDRNRFHEGGDFVRNIVVMQDQNNMLTTLPVTDQEGERVFFRLPEEHAIPRNENGRNFLWLGDAIIEDNQIKAYLIEVIEKDGHETSNRSYLGKFSYPELEYLGVEEQEEFCRTYESFFVDGETIYLYRTDGPSLWERYMHVAKAELGDLSGKKGTWRFWNGEDWVADRSQSVVIGQNNMISSSFVKLGEGNYANVYMPVLSNELRVSFATAPQGPWTHTQTIAAGDKGAEFWYYMPNFHGQLPNGNFSVSYSANFQYCLFFCRDCQQQNYVDKFWYRQRYAQVDLYRLSPYTTDKKDCANVENGTAYWDDCGECVGGTTGKFPCIDNVVKFYLSPDYAGQAFGLDAGEYSYIDLIELEFDVQQIASLELKDGYIIELFEDDDFSGSVSIIDENSADVTSEVKSLIIRRKAIEALDGVYYIQNKRSGLFMGAAGTQTNPAATQTAYSGAELQQFELQYSGNGYHKLINKSGDKLLNVVNMSKNSKTNLELWGRSEYDITITNGTISDEHNASSPGEGVWMMIDKSNGTKYKTPHDRAWVEYVYNYPCVITKYSLTSSNGTRASDPQSWTLYGSNDGENWSELDVRSDNSFSRNFEEKSFTFTNSVVYAYYRIDMSCSEGESLQVAEWRLFVTGENAKDFDSQMFVIQDAGDGYVRIINKNSDLPIEILDGLTAEGARVWQIEDVQQEGALWKLIPQGEVSIKDIRDNNGFIISPNPAREIINIESVAVNRIVISDLNGRIVYDKYPNDDKISVDVINWAKGVYLVKVYTDNGVYGQKVIKL